jgi:hypothetical protein
MLVMERMLDRLFMALFFWQFIMNPPPRPATTLPGGGERGNLEMDNHLLSHFSTGHHPGGPPSFVLILNSS